MPESNLHQLSQRAAHCTEAGDLDAARVAWQAALTLAPDSSEIMLELSYVESLAGKHHLARTWCLRAAERPPRGAQDQISLVRRLRTFNEISTLHAFVAQLLEQARAPQNVLLECARQLSNVNDPERALRCAQKAFDAVPSDVAARVLRAQLLTQFNRNAEAATELEQVLALHPGIPIAWWLLARLGKQTPESNHVAQLRGLLERPGLRPMDAAPLARALHKELDDLGDHAGAWNALGRLCQAKRSSLSYDRAQTRALIDRLIEWSTTPAQAPGTAEDVHGPTPVFIVGMHRSGTTLLEQLLDASPQLRSLGELLDFSHAMRYATNHYCKGVIDATIVARARDVDFAEVGRRYLDGIDWRLAGEAWFTDKEPANFLNIDFICRALPRAKILHLVRDPLETCFSNLRELFSDINAYSYDQAELADYYLQYRRLMAHWHARWPGRILDVAYADLTGDTESVMRKVAGFCRLEYLPAMNDPRSSARAVATASSVQVRDAVVRPEAPKWLPYAHQLRPLIDALRQGGVALPAQAMTAP